LATKVNAENTHGLHMHGEYLIN